MKQVQNGRRTREEDPVETLRADLAALRRDLSEVTSSGVSKARDAISSATDGLAELADGAKGKAVESHKALGMFAGSRPLTTIALAMVAGAVGSKLIGWRSHRGD